ncbi:MAG: B12-binding domain-containing radical SAM protein, partial [Candidatus Omnitrophica bacterium]|nr:B12-binding domain-containing radical SAM protein [Candidatus Omnitrophota bacterium]
MKPLRICLVNSRLEGPYPPLGIGYIASYLRKYGKDKYDIKIVDGNCCRDILKEVYKINPEIIGFTALSPQIKEAVDLSWQIRKWKKTIFQVVGGIHVSAMPEETLSKGAFDIEILREGEETFCELVDLFSRNKLSKDALERIKGVCFKDNGVFYCTPRREEIADLDMIPPPARDLFDMKHYLSYHLAIRGLTGSRITTVMGSRGCPFNCTFCSSKIVFKGVRQFSTEYLIAEIKDLIKQYNIKAVFFTDDTFTINKEKIRNFCTQFINEGLSAKIKWEVQGRVNLISWQDLELLQLMKKAGCVQIDYGFESGSERILDFLKKSTARISDNERAIQVTKKAGLQVMGTFMVGTPGETEADLEKTKDFVSKNFNQIGYFQTFVSTPYPGTELYDICFEKGLVAKDYFEQLSEEGLKKDGPVVYCDTVPREKVIEVLRYLNN